MLGGKGGLPIKLAERVKQLKTDIPSLYLVLRHRDTPLAAKLLAAVTVAYALSPIDLIPDFIPVLGYLDDLIVLPVLIVLTVRCVPGALWARCRAEAQHMWDSGSPKRWYFALLILLLWAVLLALLPAGFLCPVQRN